MRVGFRFSLGVALAAVVAIPVLAQPAAAPAAIVELPPKSPTPLVITTPTFKPGGDIPFENTQYRSNVFPGLSWTAGPAATKAYVVILQDTDSGRPTPWLHWVMYNVPPAVRSLPVGMAPTAQPAGAAYGPNYQGLNRPYLGPKTPPGPKHHYHFQVFAVDTLIPVDPAITYDAVVDALSGHVLASGEVIGMGELDPAWQPPPRPAR